MTTKREEAYGVLVDPVNSRSAAQQTWSVRILDLISGTAPTLSSSSTAMSLNIERGKRKQTHTSMKPDAVLPQGDIIAFNDFKIKIFFFFYLLLATFPLQLS